MESHSPMILITTTTTFVNGTPADKLSDDDIFSIISRAENEVARLEGITAKPLALQARIDGLRKGIADLVKLSDSRTGA